MKDSIDEFRSCQEGIIFESNFHVTQSNHGRSSLAERPDLSLEDLPLEQQIHQENQEHDS